MKKLLLLSLLSLLASCDSYMKQKNHDELAHNCDAITEAASEGDYTNVKIHFDKVNTFCREQALRLSSQNDHIEVVKFLLESKVNPNAGNKSIIDIAETMDNDEVVKLLIQYGADECRAHSKNIVRPRLVDTIKRRIECGNVDMHIVGKNNTETYYAGYETIIYPDKISYKDNVVKGVPLSDIKMLHSYAKTMHEKFHNEQDELGTVP